MLAATLCIPTCLCVFQLTREFFTKELKKHYVRNNDTHVFSSTWNSVMITVSQAMPVPRYWWSAAIHAALSQHLLAPPGSGRREVTVHWQPGFPEGSCSWCWEQHSQWLSPTVVCQSPRIWADWLCPTLELDTERSTAACNKWARISVHLP